MMKDICKVCTDLNKELETAVTCNGEYRFTFTDYDGNKCNVTVENHDCMYSDVLKTSGKWYGIFFSRDDDMITNIGGFRVHEKDSIKHIVNKMSQMILNWVSRTRIKKPKEKKCEFKYLDEDEARINKASENLGMKFEPFQEDTMTNMTKAELEQKYWEAQRKIDEYERERDRFLKDIDERDQSISDLIDANEKLSKENNKLSVDISREKDKHDAATEKCKELAEDAKYWNRKTFEMDQKNCELRSLNRELEKELDEKSKQFDMRIEVTPETCYQIDILAREIDRLEKENKNCKGMLDTQHEHIKRVEEKKR